MSTVAAHQVRARPASEAETPGSARSLLSLARGNGWRATSTYARGPVIARRGKHAHEELIVDSLVVRISYDVVGRSRAVAIWVDGKYDTGFRYSDWLWTERVGYRELRLWVVSIPTLMPELFPALDEDTS